MKISDSLGSFELQSANLPGKVEDSKTDLRRTNSRARRAASAALNAWRAFSRIASAMLGRNSKYSVKASPTIESTIFRTSLFPSLVLV